MTLALGIAVNATIFSLVDAFLVPHLPGHDAESLVVVSSINPDRSFLPDTNPVSAPNYFAWRADTRLFADMSASDEYRTGSLAGDGQPEAISYRRRHPELLRPVRRFGPAGAHVCRAAKIRTDATMS